MKHHIAVKFIAVFLCALALFGAVCSAAGIICFTAADLYERTPSQLLYDNLYNAGYWFSQQLAHDYADRELGGCPEELIYSIVHEYFNPGCYGYILTDSEGNVLQELPIRSYTNHFTYTVSGGEYMNVLSTFPESELYPEEETYVDSDLTIYDNLPDDGAEVYDIQISYEGGTEGCGNEVGMGYLSYTGSGQVAYVSNGSEYWMEQEQIITHIAFYDEDQNLLYEIQCPYGVGTFVWDENEILTFTSYSVSPRFQAKDQADAATETTVSYSLAKNTLTQVYYDRETGQDMVAEYTMLPMPELTVELYLAPGATDQEAYWDLLTQVWSYRNELFYVLGISLLVFAVMAVYLCCAAGKKPGSQEIRAGGFNALPLDLYALGGGFGIALICAYGLEVADYLVRYSPGVTVPFVLFAGYACCLIFVGFCFACAAQSKTPNGYWWRNTLLVRCFLLAGRMLIKAFQLLDRKAVPVFEKLCRKLWLLTVRLWKGFLKILTIIFTWLFHFFDDTLDRFFRWLGSRIARFFSMLPLTWQWLLTGILLLFMLFFSILTRSEGFMLLGICACLAIVVYGAHCFGILLESAKRMGKGDLETKVSDQFLMGSFREFAGDLNALADVAVVAAQKQLRSERMKTELITNVSHDIKTPLTSIINYVDLLEKPHTDEEQEAYLEVLSRQSHQLKKLIEDLMEMSKASTGNMAVDIVCLNAAEAVNQALGEFSDKLERAQLSPVFRQPEEPIYMKADGRLAWRVMSNLLSNAVKYALPGTRLYIDLMELENKVIISFKNISREELNVSADELLERFVRGDASRNTEGSGLGLNIAQSLMELQKGQLQLLVDGDLFKVTLVFPAVKE